ncbi:MAG TPA: energy transducer TonB [Gemmatimonadales bacterium]|nr:energy transducer TonB [Gemmatimonadales bacterium]
MLADGRRLTLITALLAAPGALFGQAHHPLDSAQVAQARALCGPLDDDSILQHPLSPLRPGAVVSNRVKELEQPQISSSTVAFLQYPRSLRERGIQGRVIVAAIVDTTGHVERHTVQIVSTPHRDFGPAVQRYLERALFTPGRLYTRLIRSCVVLPIDFSVSGR